MLYTSEIKMIYKWDDHDYIQMIYSHIGGYRHDIQWYRYDSTSLFTWLSDGIEIV